MSEPQLLHWRERAFVSPATAGLILGYSGSYIRRLVAAGVLNAVRPTKGGPMFVVVASIAKYVDGLEPLNRIDAARALPRAPLYLAVSNS